jgi:hypothetical protein
MIMTGRNLCIVLVLAGLPVAGASLAGGEVDSFALRAGRVLPVSPDMPWVIERGVIVVRDGRVVAVGGGVSPPPDLPLIELPDAVVMPGLVAAATEDGSDHRGDESIAAGYRAADAFDVYGNFAPPGSPRSTSVPGITACSRARERW